MLQKIITIEKLNKFISLIPKGIEGNLIIAEDDFIYMDLYINSLSNDNWEKIQISHYPNGDVRITKKSINIKHHAIGYEHISMLTGLKMKIIEKTEDGKEVWYETL